VASSRNDAPLSALSVRQRTRQEVDTEGPEASGARIEPGFAPFPSLTALSQLAGTLSGGSSRCLRSRRALMSTPGVLLLERTVRSDWRMIVRTLGYEPRSATRDERCSRREQNAARRARHQRPGNIMNGTDREERNGASFPTIPISGSLFGRLSRQTAGIKGTCDGSGGDAIVASEPSFSPFRGETGAQRSTAETSLNGREAPAKNRLFRRSEALSTFSSCAPAVGKHPIRERSASASTRPSRFRAASRRVVSSYVRGDVSDGESESDTPSCCFGDIRRRREAFGTVRPGCRGSRKETGVANVRSRVRERADGPSNLTPLVPSVDRVRTG
jgi:hypothetical protein